MSHVAKIPNRFSRSKEDNQLFGSGIFLLALLKIFFWYAREEFLRQTASSLPLLLLSGYSKDDTDVKKIHFAPCVHFKELPHPSTRKNNLQRLPCKTMLPVIFKRGEENKRTALCNVLDPRVLMFNRMNPPKKTITQFVWPLP